MFAGRPKQVWTNDDIRIYIWCHTHISPGPLKTLCWIWDGPEWIYGQMTMNEETYMHRHSYIVFRGKIPKGLEVMHLCNNKLCLNPRHLKTGTHRENIDMAIKDGLHKGWYYANVAEYSPYVAPKNFLRRF